MQRKFKFFRRYTKTQKRKIIKKKKLYQTKPAFVLASRSRLSAALRGICFTTFYAVMRYKAWNFMRAERKRERRERDRERDRVRRKLFSSPPWNPSEIWDPRPRRGRSRHSEQNWGSVSYICVISKSNVDSRAQFDTWRDPSGWRRRFSCERIWSWADLNMVSQFSYFVMSYF